MWTKDNSVFCTSYHTGVLETSGLREYLQEIIYYPAKDNLLVKEEMALETVNYES